MNSAIFFPTQSLQFSRKFQAKPLPNPRPPCPQLDDRRNENFKRVNVPTVKLRAAPRAFLPLCKEKTTGAHATNPTGTVPPHDRHPHPERNGASRKNPLRPPPARLSCGVAEIRRRVEKEKPRRRPNRSIGAAGRTRKALGEFGAFRRFEVESPPRVRVTPKRRNRDNHTGTGQPFAQPFGAARAVVPERLGANLAFTCQTARGRTIP